MTLTQPTLTVKLTGTDQQIANALRDLARRVEVWSGDHDTSHAPMGHRGDDTTAAYHASFSDWQD
jgi:hypothetical protein